MLHIIKYRGKCMLMNRPLMFWTLAFPLILTTLFGAVLRNAYDMPTFSTIPIAIIDNESYHQNTMLQETLKQLKVQDKAMFKVQVVSDKKAKQLLKEDKVTAVVESADKFSILVKETGLSQTITQNFFDEYAQKQHMVKQVMKTHGSLQALDKVFATSQDYTKSEEKENTDVSVVFFYTLLAMNALFGGYWAINSLHTLQANQSNTAARIAVSPTHKALNLFVDLFLNIAFQVVDLAIVFIYMYVILGVDFGNQLGYISLAIFLGILAGNGLGLTIGCLFPQKEVGMKTGVLTAITMLGSFLSGMMMVQMKYLIQVYAPFLAYINPVNMITDALYSLYYYGAGERYYMNLGLLLLFTALCYSYCYHHLRKTRYQSLGVH